MRRIVALIVLLAMVAGPPALLLAWGFTDWTSIHLWSISDIRPLLGVLTAVGWVVWGLWMVAVVIELVVALSGRRIQVTLPGLGLPRALASALVGAILAAGSVSTAFAAPVPGAPAASIVVAQEAPAGDASELSATTAPSAAEAPAGPSHTVSTGDDLWSLAQRYYGDGGQWRTIVAANPSLQADPTARLVAGSTLAIPDPVVLVTVQSGDTLSALARQHLGEASRWPEIHRLNTHRIADPDLIHPGWVLKVPMVLAPPQSEPPQSAPLQSEPVQSEPADPAAPAVAEEAAPDVPAPEAVPAEQEAPPAEIAPTADETPDRLAPAADLAPASGLLGGMTALSAAAVLGGVGLRRRLQARQRPLGRRYAAPEGELSRYEAALTQVATVDPARDRVQLLDRAMRLLGRHWWSAGVPAPALRQAVVGPDDVEFVFVDAPATAPDGFTRIGQTLAVSWLALAGLEHVDHPVAYPALVTLGEADADRLVMVDVMAAGVLGVRDDSGDAAGEVLSALLVELACAPWASEVDLLVVTGDPHFADAAGEGRIVCEPEVEDGVAAVERLTRQRSRFVAERGWDAGRLDPDLAEAWSAQVVLFERPPDADQLARLEAAIAQHPCGVAAVAVVPADRASSVDWQVVTDADGVRRLTDTTAVLTAQTVPADTRRALTELYELAQTTVTEPADWWTSQEDDVNIIALRPTPVPPLPDGPRLRLLGPVGLTDCAGTEPPRAQRQCLEYCAWLHLHPGSTPAQMVQALLVAEGTRRSNMSRLRTWLGTRPDGGLYLPDAYSGRIALHDDVSSDWEEFTLLTAGGIDRLPLDRLVTALDLVRGAPLADAAPGQWGWAEEFRSDAAALIRDVGVVAARLARERGDLDTARWAANRALSAAPDDELLLGERIRIEHAAGRGDEVQRLVQRVTRVARALGVDLLPETVDLCQEVVEGRLRARA